MSTTPAQTPATFPPAPPPSAGPDTHRRRWLLRRPQKPITTTIYLLVLLGFTALFLYPFLWVVSASLKTRPEVFDNRLIPNDWNPVNYVHVFFGVPGIATGAPFGRWYLNSLYVDGLAALTVTISSALVAFAFAYFRFPLRNFLFACVLGSMMLPGAVTMIPTYLIWNEIGKFTLAHAWLPHIGVGTQYPLWMGNLFGSAFYIFLMRQFFLGIPRELFEAARMDGDNYLTMFWRIVVPLAKPALIVTFIFELKAKWTDLINPLIYLRDDSQFTIPRGLYALLGVLGPNAGGHGDYQVVLAALVCATVPMIIVFFLGQKYFIEQGGIAAGGKG